MVSMSMQLPDRAVVIHALGPPFQGAFDFSHISVSRGPKHNAQLFMERIMHPNGTPLLQAVVHTGAIGALKALRPAFGTLMNPRGPGGKER